MKLLILSTIAITLAACAHQPRCGDAAGAKTVYFEDSCRTRIRQIVVGSEINIPSNVKKDALSNFDLEWVDPATDSGQVSLGHYDLVPKGQVAK